MSRHIYTIPDYEHTGDLEWGKQRILEKYPNAKIIRAWEEEDYEAESDYEDDYGVLDEPIMQGYVEYELPN